MNKSPENHSIDATIQQGTPVLRATLRQLRRTESNNSSSFSFVSRNGLGVNSRRVGCGGGNGGEVGIIQLNNFLKNFFDGNLSEKTFKIIKDLKKILKNFLWKNQAVSIH